MTVFYKTELVGDVEVFYREAGDKNAPVLLLLHGFPTSKTEQGTKLTGLRVTLAGGA